MTLEVDHHDRRAREQRQHGRNAKSVGVQAIHDQLADVHAEKANALREDAELAAQEAHRRLAEEAKHELERGKAAAEEYLTRANSPSMVPRLKGH